MVVEELTKLVLDKAAEMEDLCLKRKDLNYQALNLEVIQPISEKIEKIKSSSLQRYEADYVKKLNDYLDKLNNLSREDKASYNTLTLKKEVCKLKDLID